MREISTRLEEMPAEEGYPAYLAARIAAFYERAGRVHCLGKPEREGALSVVGAVSPPGGDLSDPVVQATLHVVKVFWSLKAELAYQRHFPAIDWLTSYSFYQQYLPFQFDDREQGDEMLSLARRAMSLLQQESELREIVRLVGAEALSAEDRLALDTARMLREDFLYQNAFHPVDTYASLNKQYEMLKTVLYFHQQALAAVQAGADVEQLFGLAVREEIARSRFVAEDDVEKITGLRDKIDEQIKQLQPSAA